jgi:tol-pal system protein YbgF
MLVHCRLPKLSLAMIRSASVCLLVALLACAFSAGAVRAQDSPTEMVTRIERLETTIRNLTGNVEQLQYRNQQLEQQVQRLQEELQTREEPKSGARPAAVPQRPAAQYPAQGSAPAVSAPPPLSRPQYPPASGSAPAVAAAPLTPSAPLEPVSPGGRRGDAFDPSMNPTAPGAPRPLGTSTAATEPPPPLSDAQRPLGAPLDLSTPGQKGGTVELPPPPPVNPSSTGATATLPPTNTAKDAYDLAYGYVMHKDYALAADTFRLFLRQFPSDRLAPEALYWLGESSFQQQQYRDAAESFLAVSTKYDTTSRAPEALLRLGQSLAAMGEKEAACASLGEVLRKYPHAGANVKQAVEREQKRGHC